MEAFVPEAIEHGHAVVVVVGVDDTADGVQVNGSRRGRRSCCDRH